MTHSGNPNNLSSRPGVFGSFGPTVLARGGLGGFCITIPSLSVWRRSGGLLKLPVLRKKLPVTLNLLFEEVIESRVRFGLYKFHLVSFDNNFDIVNT